MIYPTSEVCWRFVFAIKPETIITLEEKPALKGKNEMPVPGETNVPNLKADTATLKWDVSRQMQTTLHNPASIPTPDLEAIKIKPIDFPRFDYEGNDDAILADDKPDEDANPYVARVQSVQADAPVDSLTHEIGELSSIDRPGTSVLNSWGRDQIEFGVETTFREFARLEIYDGEKERDQEQYWYRISDFEHWHHVLSAKFNSSSGKWDDAGSKSGTGLPK
jgi:hypothetical protein